MIINGTEVVLTDGETIAPGVGNGGNTGPQIEGIGSHTVSEVAATGTNIANYAATISYGTETVKRHGSLTGNDLPWGTRKNSLNLTRAELTIDRPHKQSPRPGWSHLLLL